MVMDERKMVMDERKWTNSNGIRPVILTYNVWFDASGFYVDNC